jgi:hypothetical protein
MDLAELIDTITLIDYETLEFHAQRYESGAGLQALIILCMPPQDMTRDQIGTIVRSIARHCCNDGSAYGFIPCLGGTTLEMWNTLKEEFDI